MLNIKNTHWFQDQQIPKYLAVAWSGGLDSTALLLALKQQGHQVVAWHIDHGWCPQSTHNAMLLAEWAKDWHIPFFKTHLTGISESNKEARSRQLRYQQFSIWSKEQQVHILATAHHADDQAETVCMRLLQGSGSRGCQGIPYRRTMEDLTLIRPCLRLSKQMLESALKEANIPWLEDASNTDTRFLRNQIRHQLFPQMEKHSSQSKELFARLGQQMQRLNHDITKQSNQHHITTSSTHVCTPWQAWVQLDAVIRVDVLRRMFEILLGKGKTPGRRHFEFVERWLKQGGKGGIDLCGSRLSHQEDNLHLQRVIDKLRSAAIR
ncbi:MAG: tRNA lysidine(34) synthetase TilS [Mariprofundaceae bacterium]|nr:tRNA lysidine(34) synthetase TilS [Mariprofundaceae bacterium]